MTVSIILPIYNRAHTLPRCLASIRAQSVADWELIAVDDGSTDGSVEMMQREAAQDSRIRLLQHPENKGAAAARNTALAAAEGEYIALIDSDDEWLPDKLYRQLNHLARTGASGCGCEYFVVKPDGTATHFELPRYATPEEWRLHLHTRCELGSGSTLLAKREALQAIGPLDESLRIYEDWEWMLRFCVRFPFTVLHEPLARIYDSGKRQPTLFAESAEQFLTRADAELSRRGRAHRWLVRSYHYQYAAGNALRQEQWKLGLRYVWKFFAARGRSLLAEGGPWGRRR